MLRFYALFVGLCSFAMHATEIDNFTHRALPLRDIRNEINNIVNGYFYEIIDIANQKNSCDEKAFLVPLAKRIGTGFVSNIEKEIQNNHAIDQAFTKRRDSIYQDFRIYQAPGIFITGLASLINVDGILIGTDKLGHFLGTGFSYYKRLHYKDKSLKEVLKYGDRTERTYYGLMLNGVYSYADLAANIDGLSFWERVIGTGQQDKTLSPYVRCENNQWSINSTFDIGDYLSRAWDEGINCNRYRNEKMHRKVLRRLNKLGFQTITTQCPISVDECQSLIERYQENARGVLNPACFKN